MLFYYCCIKEHISKLLYLLSEAWMSTSFWNNTLITLFQRHYWSFHLILWSKHERKNFKCFILLKQLIRNIYKLNWSRVKGYRSIEAKPSQTQSVEAVSRWIATVLDTDPLYRSVSKCKSPVLQYTADRERCLFFSVIRHSNKFWLLIVTSL